MQKRGLFFLFTFLLLFAGVTQAQPLTTTSNGNASQLAATLVGNGVTILNETLNCPSGGSGTFNGGNAAVGLNSGVMLTSGQVGNALPPNASGSTGTDNNANGDADLNAITNPFQTYDACVLEFDIIPSCDTIQISYVFGSEEYPEFVNAGFNDVFAFWISGPGYATPTNIALVPGSVTPVSIDNVNLGNYNCPGPTTGCTNCAYYVDNCNGNNVEYDGYTVPLQALAAVQPCSTYHIKLAIADAGDGIYDSGVFLESAGIGCVSQVISIEASNVIGSNILVEGCNTATLDFIRDGNVSLPYDITYQVIGNATNGVDVTYIPDSLHFNPGQDSIGFTLFAPDDGINEGLEIIYVIINDTICSLTFGDTAAIMISDPPQAEFTNTSGCSGATIQFTDQSSFVGGTVNGWEWDFGDGNTSTLQNPSHTYAAGGTYTVTLIIDTDLGCPDTISHQIGIFPPPVAQFTYAGGSCANDVLQFTDQSTISSGTVTGWNWDFGDGNNSTNQNPTHAYGASGNYTVTLIVTSNNGCMDTLTQQIVVSPDPTASFNFSNPCDGETVQFSDASTVNPGSISGWSWDFGDGNSSTQQSPTHLYGTPGSYTVTLSVMTADGCTDTISQVLAVYPLPVADFTTTDVCDGEAVQFTDQSTISSGSIPGYAWDFGDGNSSTQQNPSHTYGGPGTYTVTLTVTSDNGCTDDFNMDVTVFPEPTADFTVADHCEGTTAQFTDGSSVPGGAIISWDWDFGDGSSSTVTNPTHTYSGPGTYTVTLTVTTDNGCTDDISINVEVWGGPTAEFTSNEPCLFDTTFFTNQSTISAGSIASTTWDFGDGSGSSDSDPWHIYATNGTFTVTLTVVSDEGCTDQITHTAFVGEPASPPIITHDTVCRGLSAIVTAVPPAGSTVNWYYTSNGSDPFHTGHTYNTPPLGTHETYWVQVTSPDGCRSLLHPVHANIYPYTTPNVSISDHTVEIPNALIELTTNPNHDIISYFWGFGDGSNSSSSDPVHQYTAPGLYDISLHYVDEFGCEYDILLAEWVEVLQQINLLVPSAFTPNGDGLNDEFWVGTRLITDLEIQIFDRWGKLLFESENMNFRWDGTDVQGVPVPEGAYTYRIRATTYPGEVINRAGTITVIR